MLTWKEIKTAVETGNEIHPIKETDTLTYLLVHLDTVCFGVVGQDGFATAQHFTTRSQLQKPAESNPRHFDLKPAL